MKIHKENLIYGDKIYDSVVILSYINFELYFGKTYIFTDNSSNYTYYPSKYIINDISFLEKNLNEQDLLIIDFESKISKSFYDKIKSKILIVDYHNLYFNTDSEIFKIDNHIKSYDTKFYIFYKNELIDLIHFSDYENYINIHNLIIKN